ncbi:MAG: hypothetical protein IT534_03630 [Bauldia sp.]|nr:hypothetical protein [Bauldia sp.]
MTRQTQTELLIGAMIVTILAVDALFLRDRFGLRLATNIGIVVVFLSIYVGFIRGR